VSGERCAGIVRSTPRLREGVAAALLLLGLAATPPRVLAAGAAEPGGKLQQALLSAEKGDWQWARRLAEDVGGPELRSYFRWRELLESDDRPAFAVYGDFLRRGDDWPSLGTLQARAEEAVDDGVGIEERLAFFADRAPRTRQGRARYAQALLAAGRQAEAVALLRKSWVVDDFSAGEEGFFLDRFGAFLEVRDDAARLDRLLWDRRIEQARRMLPRVAGRDRVLALARLKLQLSDASVEAALADVPKELQRDPGLLFDRLRWRLAKGNEAGVREILLDPPADLKRPELWWAEQQRVIRDAIGEHRFELAYRLAASHGQKEGTPFSEAEWLAGWLALRFLDQPERARRHFERMWPAVETPISRGRAAYWAGRAAAAAGDHKGALAWHGRAAQYPSSFYGQLAAEELGVDIALRLGPQATAAPAARAALKRRLPAQLGAFFCKENQPRYAQPFFRHLGWEGAERPDELKAVVELARSCDRADLVLAAVRAAAGNGAFLVRDAYPLPRLRAYHERGEGMPEPALLLGLSRQESLFDPAARSGAGALGLMQLMPATAEAVSRELGVPFQKSRLLRDPEYNVRLGALYLQKQLDRYDGEPALALAAYNAGPSRVRTWLDMHGDPRGADPYRLIDWIERIPFAETRNYVQRVLEGRGMYRAILSGPRPSPARTASDGDDPLVPRPKPAS
jgi:soluble lytic murein transglycosylase